MASSRTRRSPRRQTPQSWQRTIWASAGLLYLGGALQLIAPMPAAAQTPPLPTPCAGGPCGVNGVPTNFVTSGQVAAPVVNGNTMTIQQQSDRAILNWQDFNVANGYAVKFNQPAATSQALNRIWSADPSKIAGKLDANGQILLLNQNGIVFDQGAQVNVGALTASTLNLSDERFEQGLLAGAANLPVLGDGKTVTGAVEVKEGAALAAASGGRIMLLGTKVSNAGSISTPDGQTILAAGKTVYLAASTDPALRGLLIEVDSSTWDDSGLPGTTPKPEHSEVTNTGTITAARGNVTVAGMVVKQAGKISATTAIGANGSIYLLAGDADASAPGGFSGPIDGQSGPRTVMLPNRGGTLLLSEGSVTEVVADPNDTGTITEQNQAQFITSEVNLVGKTVILREATVRAPGGRVDINAAANPLGALREPPDESDGSRIYIDELSRIDAAGLKDVAVDVTRNLLSVRLTSNDLQDAPLQRDGFLRGRTVVVDARTGSTLFKVAPYAGGIKHTVQEQLTRGGSITLRSAGDVITREGSVLDVSAGSVAYQGGLGAATTRLLGADGKVYDIATAPLDIKYVGFADSYSFLDPTWGVTSSLSSRVQYAGYTEGADAGTLSVFGPDLYLRGLMEGKTFANPFERDPTRIGLGGALVIGDFRRRSDVDLPVDLRAPSLVLVDGATDLLAADFDPEQDALPSAFRGATVISPGALADAGFTRLNLSSNGVISLESTLRLGPRGSLDAFGQAIAVNADIDIAGGSVSLQSSSKPGSALAPHDITLAAGRRIDVSGRWTNDLAAAPGAPGTGLVVLDGGSVSLRAEGDVILGEGSSIDVSGGARLRATNKLDTGRAGALALEANAGLPGFDVLFGTVRIGNDVLLRGASFAPGKGGTLTLRSAALTIGDLARDVDGELRLDEEFFNAGNGGFSRYALTGAVSVAIGGEGDAVHLAPVQQVLGFTTDTRSIASGTDLRDFTRMRAPLDEQAVAVDLAFSSSTSSVAVGDPRPGVGDVVLAAGSSIGTGPGGSVTLGVNGYLGNLAVLGDITARGGNIRLQLGTTAAGSGDFGFIDLAHGGYDQQLRLGAEADLDARGIARVSTLNALGLRQGEVLDGGSVSLVANKGFIVTEAGSTIDVSAASAVLDLPVGSSFVATAVAGDAGKIAIDAREGLDLRGALRGRAADVAGSAGGTLSIGLGAVPGVPGASAASALYNHTSTSEFNNTGPRSPYSTAPRVLTLSAVAASDLPSTLASGSAQLSTQTLGAGGFDNLALKSTDEIRFADSLVLRPSGSLVLDAPVLQVADDALVKLGATTVSLGYALNVPGATQTAVNPFVGAVDTPTLGSHAGRLLVGDEATRLIDVRGSSLLRNVADATFRSAGDIRLGFAVLPNENAPYASGSLYSSGDLRFHAAQMYPVTASRFDIHTPQTVSISSPAGAAPKVPLSAGGDLRISARLIEQAGVLRAPIGSIQLNATERVTLAAGSLTSVSAEGSLIPFGALINGAQYSYDFGNPGTTLVGEGEEGKASIPLPEKRIGIEAPEIEMASTADGDAADARLDLSGGGDLYAYEFIAGPGGSQDVLDPASGRYAYAIVPALGEGYAPMDLQYQAGTDIPVGKTLQISGVPGIADGNYVLLPARYALLPGAYAVQLVKPASDAPAGVSVARPDGSYVAAGRFGVAGTDTLDSRTSTVLITPGAVVRTQSQYNESTANEFFTERSQAQGTVAPLLPADAGALELAATVNLQLGRAIDFSTGQFTTGSGSSAVTHTGIGGQVSIVAPQIAVIDTGATGVDGALNLAAEDLNALEAQTLLLGARRRAGTEGDTLEIGSQRVTVRNSAAQALDGPEIILAARDALTLEAGSAITTSGQLTGTPRPLIIEGDGAVLRASAGDAIELHRALVPDADAALRIADGASVTAGGSLLLDSSGTTSIGAGAELRTPDLTLSSNRVNLGEVPADAEGLNLSAGLLEVLEDSGLRRLRLNSASSIDLYGTVELGGEGAAALELLQLNAGALLGHGEGDKSLSAGRIVLGNGADAPTTGVGDGSGALELQAVASATEGSGVIALGDGELALRGFAGETAVNLQADRELRLAGDGALALDVDGALSLRSPRIAADAGATSRIENASGAVEVLRIDGLAGAAPTEAGFGASLQIRGTSVRQAGNIELLSGALRMEATDGDVLLDAGSSTRAAGASRLFFDVPAAAPAGTIELIAQAGDVVVAQGASIDVSAAQTEDLVNEATAGNLRVSAAQGEFRVDGTLLGHAAQGGDGAGFELDVARLADLDALSQKLVDGGFDGAQALRVRTGDVSLGATTTVQATRYTLSADQGSIRVAGRIDTGGGTALGPNGGAISLWAGQDLDVSGATLDTHAAALEPGERPGRGGDVTLGTREGAIVLDGAHVDQAGAGRLADGSADTSTHGVLTLRAPRTTDGMGAPAVAISGGATVELPATRTVVIEGNRVYQGTRVGADPDEEGVNLSLGTDGRMFTEAQAFSDAAPQIVESVFGAQAASLPVQLRAGIEVQSSGDLSLASNWNLAAWRFNGAPVNLSLRAAGNLDLAASLSDGFDSAAGALPTWKLSAAGESASYRLVSGADLSAANPLALQERAVLDAAGLGGNMTLAANQLIRTGTGDIALGVGGDLVLSAQTSVIYTAGVAAAPLADFLVPTKAPTFRGTFNPAYPTGGGDVSIDVGGDIHSAPSAQLVTDWMWRRGRVNDDGTIISNQSTSWWIMFDRFQQGVATFGGGDLDVRAGGDIGNLSATVVSNGRLAGAANTAPTAENLSVNGGGQLSVQAGGDILSGVFQVDWGNARVRAGGDLASGRTASDTNPNAEPAPVQPIFVLGYRAGRMDVSARGDVHLDAAINSTVLRPSVANRTAAAGLPRAYFYTLDGDSRIDLVSAGGDVLLDNQLIPLAAMAPDGTYDPSGYDTEYFRVYPPSVNAIALSGDVASAGFQTIPAADVAINLLAHGDVRPGILRVHEADPERLVSPLRPFPSLNALGVALDSVPRPLAPLHRDDAQPIRIVAQTGDIDGSDGLVTLPKPARIIAGGDISNLRFSGKNLDADDVTLLMAGGDIAYTTATNASNQLVTNSAGIEVAGPGYVEVLAGGDLNLGNSQGIVSTGNFGDVRLPAGGATLVVGAGFGRDAQGQRTPAYTAFTDAYLAPRSDGSASPYASTLVKYVAGLTGVAPESLDATAALMAFRNLPDDQQLPLIAKVLIQELSETGLDHSRLGTDYERGYKAIRTLFPEKDAQERAIAYDGDINMSFSQIKTQQGGDINLLAPGGSVVVGLPNPPADLIPTKITTVGNAGLTVPAEANLGLLVLANGAIGGFAEQNFEVNQSRVLTLQGGDIILWASEGDIDAGRGAKSASGAPPPVIQTDDKGNVFVNPVGAVAGSGIGQLLTKPGVTPGLVNLIAPKGEVNAGEAGIRVAGNLNIAAVRVVGADNISVSGTATGVPVSDAGALSGALSGANALGDAGKNASDQLSQNLANSAADSQRLADSLKPSFVMVKLFCLGDECEIR